MNLAPIRAPSGSKWLKGRTWPPGRHAHPGELTVLDPLAREVDRHPLLGRAAGGATAWEGELGEFLWGFCSRFDRNWAIRPGTTENRRYEDEHPSPTPRPAGHQPAGQRPARSPASRPPARGHRPVWFQIWAVVIGTRGAGRSGRCWPWAYGGQPTLPRRRHADRDVARRSPPPTRRAEPSERQPRRAEPPDGQPRRAHRAGRAQATSARFDDAHR